MGPGRKFCSRQPGCADAAEQVAEGVRLCGRCGGEIPSPELRALAFVATQNAETLRRLGDREAEAPQRSGSRLLGPREAGEVVGRSAQYLREHFEEFGGRRIGDGPKPRYEFPEEPSGPR
jgi:hypothetical protein